MKTVIIIASLAALAALFFVTKNLQQKARARKCAKEVQRFHERLQQLSDPSHLFSDKELHALKREFAPLLDEVNDLYDNRLIDNEYLDKLGLKEFMDERRLLNYIQYQNLQCHK